MTDAYPTYQPRAPVGGGGGERGLAMKTCPICGTKAFLATRKCKAECGWNFSEKVLERPDGGSAARAAQERKRAKPVEESVVTKSGNITTHSNIDPEDDGNMDSCIVCGDIGMLICCDLCPLSYHADCAGLDKIPMGFWSCPQCTAKNLQSVTASEASRAASVGGGIRTQGGVTSSIGLGGGIQTGGLDAFHSKLNTCLDYSDTQSYECDGYTFLCFQPPDLNLISSDPRKQAEAQARFQANKEAREAAAAAALKKEEENNKSEPMKTEA